MARKHFLVWTFFSALALSGALSANAQSGAPGASMLPEGPGRATLVRVCSSCHTPEIAARQKLTPDAWKELVETMANQGAVATDEELSEITNYLVTTFPERETGVSLATE